MPLRNTPDRFGSVARFFHWSVAALVAYQFVAALSFGVDEDTHGTIGIVIFGLVVLRLAWRWIGGLPEWAPELSGLERRLTHRVEQVLYLALLAKPLTGLALIGADGDEIEVPLFGELSGFWVESDGWEDFFEAAHAWSGYVLLAAIAVHLALVLKHRFIDRDRLVYRMLPFTRP